MRVCILTRGDLFPPHHGAAVKIVRTAEHLSRLSGEPAFLVSDDRDRYLRFDGPEVTEVPFPPRLRAAQEWPPIPRLGRAAERLCGLVGYPAEEHFLYRPQFDPAWWLRAAAVGLAEDIDVFQAEFPGYGVPAWLAARALTRLRGRPVRSAVVQHNVEWDRLEEFGRDVRRIRAIERQVLRMVDTVIAVSEDDRRRMAAAGVDGAKIQVIPHGVDAAGLARAGGEGIRARYGIPADAPLLFFHGTLHYWPNTEAVRHIAERLLPRLLPELPGLRVLIAGMSPPLYYAHPAITYPGPVDDLAEHIAASDLCLCPVTAGGGTRLKLLEYMAAGKPTVSTTKGAEGIPHGGALAIADGPDAFAAEVLRLLADRESAAALGRRAARFAARYDWPAVTARYLALYEGRPAAAAPDIEAHLPPRVPSKPLTLLLLINRGCNLRCRFCDLWDNHVHMPLDRLLPLLDEAAAIGTKTLVITGGEPFLHPGLFQAIAAAKARGMAVNVTTNGTLVEKHWAEVASSGVDSLSFSLDGLEETHDRLRGQRGAWKRTLKALERVQRAGGIATSVYFVATNQNIRDLVPLYERVRSLGSRFDFWPVNDAPDLYIVAPADRAAWEEAVAHIAARDPEIAGRRAFYADGLRYHAGESAGPARCLGLVDQYGVTYEGDLLPCCVWGGEGLKVGNVFQTPLSQLWTTPAVQAHRQKLYGQGCSAGCFNHSLYEFSASTGESFRLARRA